MGAAAGVAGLPDLSFLEHDAALWDTFFLHGKKGGGEGGQMDRGGGPSVLQHPLPVEEYLLREQLRRCRSRSRRSPATPVSATLTPTRGSLSSNHQQAVQAVPPHVRDAESLRMLLPNAHKHLLGPAPPTSGKN